MTAIQAIMDNFLYIQILGDNLVTTMQTLCIFNGIDNMILQQDGNPKHTANYTTE